MNDIDFRNTLIKALELDSHFIKDKPQILSALLKFRKRQFNITRKKYAIY